MSDSLTMLWRELLTLDLGTIATAFSLIGAIAGWIVAAFKSRETSLRRDDVHKWANSAIAELQTLVLICRPDNRHNDRLQDKVCDVQLNSSILVEQGRLYFRNSPAGGYGRDKPEAYRGHRPVILDHLILAHQIATRWPSCTAANEAARLAILAERCLKAFVSLAQKEVGRSRAASSDAARSGENVDLHQQLLTISDVAVTKWVTRRPLQTMSIEQA